MAKATGRPAGRPRAAVQTEQIAFRFAPGLLARVDAFTERLRAEAPWANVTRADAVRALLVDALDALGVEPVSSPAVTGKAPRGRKRS